MLRITSDLDHSLNFSEESVAVSRKTLRVSSGSESVLSIPMKDLVRAYVEEGLSVAKLVVQTRQKREIEVAYFTKRKTGAFRRFADALNRCASEGRMIDESFDEKEKQVKGSINTMLWLYRFTRRHRRMIYTGLALSLVSVVFALVPPYLLKILVDGVILAPQHSEALFIELTLTLIASYGVFNLVGAYQNYVLTKAGFGITTDLMSRMFGRVLRLSPDSIDKISTSRIQSRLTSDAGNTQWMLTYGIATTVTNGLTIIGIGVMLFVLFPSLAVYVLIPIPFIVLIAYLYGKRSRPAYHRQWRKNSDMYTTIYNIIPNYLVVKTAAKEENEHRHFDGTTGGYFNSKIILTKMGLKYWQPVTFMMALATVLIWWIGGNGVISGATQLGVVIAFITYMGMFYSPISQLSSIIPYVEQGITSGERIRELFNREYDPRQARRGKRADMQKGIAFRNVVFGYDPLLPILRGVNANIPAHKRTAIVGKSGSGKTTMVKLLLKLYEKDSGEITIGRESIDDIDTAHLRERIAYVPQDPAYFDGSIRYNLAYYAHTRVRPINMIASVKAVEMHDEVMRLPLRYDNRLRGRGVNLSGGQRQRLSIARAMLNDSDIVLLDEVTASLDAINARKVHKAILNIEKGKTMVIIAHDVNEIMSSDNIILLENGRVTEQGSPHDLLRIRGGLFKMFRHRFGVEFAYRKPVGRTIWSFVEGISCNEKDVKVTRSSRAGLVDAVHFGRKRRELAPEIPFPISDPGFIILADRRGREALAIEDMGKLDSESMEALRSCLEVNRISATVTGIRRIRMTGDGISWDLNTDRGSLHVLTRGRSDVTDYNGGIVLIDEFGIPIRIERDRLDRKSASLLERSI